MTGSKNQAATVVWLRDDLRIADNPALAAACERGEPLVVLYVLDEKSEGIRPLGGAAKAWLHESLAALAADLASRGQNLILKRGKALDVVSSVARAAGAKTVCWNRRYGPAEPVDEAVRKRLRNAGIAVEVHEAILLHAPRDVRTQSGETYQIFSAFWRAAQKVGEPRPPIPAPAKMPPPVAAIAGDDLADLQLLPEGPDWTAGIRETWTPGESGARRTLDEFLERASAYAEERDLPAADSTSRLSPYLRFGEISPHQVWEASASIDAQARTKFRGELGWREFNWHLLAERPDLTVNNLKPAFDAFPWGDTYADDMWAWRRGRTGYPVVDAGMRQLWHTGWMHNRVRMIVASFLVKHLLADWRIGEEWFWDTLVDADPANNPVNWQWAAGSGADAQPFFRIFNPVLQGEKFDPDGDYVRRYVPELAKMPAKYIHKPWQAPDAVLAEAGVQLGRTYPEPIVDHAMARQRALDAFETMRRRAAEGDRRAG